MTTPRGRRRAWALGLGLTLAAVAAGGGRLLAQHAGADSGPAGSATPTEALPASGDLPGCAVPTLVGTLTSVGVTAREAPSQAARPVASFHRINPQGAPQVFDLGTTEGEGGRWYRAALPVRPNGTSGFIPADALNVELDPYRIVVDREHLTLTLSRACSVVRTFTIGLGKESTPTPNGTFYIISLLRPPTGSSIYGPYAYGLSAFSDAITDWAGGGVIGIHGTDDPSSIGDRKSHGCIRMRNRDIEYLVPILPLGTPVEIR